MTCIFKTYKKLISLIICFFIISLVTLFIKFYFKPFLIVIVLIIICNPIYDIMLKSNIPEKLTGVLTIVSVNIILILLISYLGNEIYNVIKEVYIKNVEFINGFIQEICKALNLDFSNLKIGTSVFSIINDANIRKGAVSTGEIILAYFIANICTFFILVDKKYIKEVLFLLLPVELEKKITKQKNNLRHMITIEVILILMSTFEIMVGFMILNIPNFFTLGIVCGILDILPYVGTIIVFIPIIIYNIIKKKYFVAFGLICVYILVQIIREILEAKFLGDKLEIHPLVILISLYIGVNIFGILGILVGPMYSILAKEIIYGDE